MARNRLCRSVPGFSWCRESAGGHASPPQYLLDWYCKRRKRSNAGAPGAKPPAKLTYSLPLPAGKGVGGMGERKHTEGRDSRRQRRQAPPADSETAKSAGDKEGKPPLRTANTPAPAPRESRLPPQYLLDWYCKRRKRSNAGAPGAKPPAKLTYSLPLPAGEGGRGDGAGKKLKARLAGDQKGKPPPCGFRNGKVSRRPKRQAPPPPLPSQKNHPLG